MRSYRTAHAFEALLPAKARENGLLPLTGKINSLVFSYLFPSFKIAFKHV